jgi:hypothetical protein
MKGLQALLLDENRFYRKTTATARNLLLSEEGGESFYRCVPVSISNSNRRQLSG